MKSGGNSIPRFTFDETTCCRVRSDGMRTTMIGPNYRWRGRALDALVSLSETRLAFNHPLFALQPLLSSTKLSRSPLAFSVSPVSLPFPSPQGPPMPCTRPHVSWQVYTRIFLPPPHPIRQVHPTPPRGRFSCFNRHLRLSPPPAPKEIKPHLSALIIVVTYERRSPRVLEKRAWAVAKTLAGIATGKKLKEGQRKRVERRCIAAVLPSLTLPSN